MPKHPPHRRRVTHKPKVLIRHHYWEILKVVGFLLVTLAILALVLWVLFKS